MITKLCNRCGIEKPIDDFWKKKSTPDGYDRSCGDCSREYHRNLYTNNDKRKKDIRTNSRRRNLNTLKWKNELTSTKGCADCGVTDFRVLDFDHVSDDKVDNISSMIRAGRSRSMIIDEMNKCEVVCANCHRIRTYERRASKACSSTEVTPP